MSQLCLYLPPFSSDYSGVCSALYELNGMIVIHDASCCPKNYGGFDEPRPLDSRKPAFISRLREMDAIMGDDEKLVRKIRNTYGRLTDKPDFIALLGSPVPAIIGSDMPGIAREIEEDLEVPAFGFSTTGFKYYDEGVSDAMLALTKRFTKDPSGERRGVNILGLTPLDFSDNGNAENLIRLLEAEDIPVVCSYMMGLTLDDIRAAAGARVNLVVSESGVKLARYMEARWGIPYAAGTAFGEDGNDLAALIKKTMSDGESRALHAEGSGESNILIIGDQILANSLRCRLITKFGVSAATVASFFGLDRRLADEGDVKLHNEEELCGLLSDSRYRVIIGDPLIGKLPETEGKCLIPIPHVAISGKLYWHEYSVFQSRETDEMLEEAALKIDGAKDIL